MTALQTRLLATSGALILVAALTRFLFDSADPLIWWPCFALYLLAGLFALRANIAENEGDIEEMRREAEIAREQFSDIGDRWGLASTLSNIALGRTLDGDLEGAVVAYEEAVGCLETLNAVGDTGMRSVPSQCKSAAPSFFTGSSSHSM